MLENTSFSVQLFLLGLCSNTMHRTLNKHWVGEGPGPQEVVQFQVFALVDHFLKFRECILDISKWFHFCVFFHYDQYIYLHEYFFQNLWICTI